MYLPRPQIAQLYTHLKATTHISSPPVLILTSLTVDSLCATRILSSLLRNDGISHQVDPISGYADLQKTGSTKVLPLTRQRGGDGGTVVCLGLGGAVALDEVLGLDGRTEDGTHAEDMEAHGVEVWVIDSRRPWNLENVFGASAAQTAQGSLTRRPGVREGRISAAYKPGEGGIVVWADEDLEEELRVEKEAYFALQDMPEITENDLALVGEDDDDDEEADGDDDENREEAASRSGNKRKRGADDDGSDEESDTEDERSPARRRRRSNSSASVPIPSSPGGNPLSAQIDVASTPPTMPSSPPRKKTPSAKQQAKQLLKLRRKHESTLDKYYDRGSSGAEPVSSMLYSLASELGREDNELLWLAIVGISAVLMSPHGAGVRVQHFREVLQDEVRRLNPIPEAELQRSQNLGPIIPTTARSATDNGIRLSPEPRFLLLRHWSLYDAMRHSPYLATRLHLWSDNGQKRLHKLLAKMGVSLQEAGQGYLHMKTEIKHILRERILKFAEQYNLEGLVPGDKGPNGKESWGFVRSWGWRGTLSAEDVAIVIGAILEVGTDKHLFPDLKFDHRTRTDFNYNARIRNLPTPPHSSDDGMSEDLHSGASDVPNYVDERFFCAYDSLAPSRGLATLQKSIPAAQNLYKAILRVGSHLISKHMIRHLRAFRMGVVREGPDLALFTHPGALVRLASWIGEAVAVLEAEKGRKPSKQRRDDALVLGALDETRSVYVVVGLGGGNGWNGSGKNYRSKAEIKEREEKKKRKEADRLARKAAAARKREERRQLRRERNAANGLDSDDDFESESEAETESDDDSDDSDSDSDNGDAAEEAAARKKRGPLNRFGQAFQEVVEETGARVRIDSFEHSVVEVKKEDFHGFLEALSLKTVVN